MSLLTLELKNEADLDLFISFAKRLNVTILDIKQTKKNEKQSPVIWLEKIAKKGGVKSISNPSEWQREIRTDPVLPNRD
jgi:hypothetical protein